MLVEAPRPSSRWPPGRADPRTTMRYETLELEPPVTAALGAGELVASARRCRPSRPRCQRAVPVGGLGTSAAHPCVPSAVPAPGKASECAEHRGSIRLAEHGRSFRALTRRLTPAWKRRKRDAADQHRYEPAHRPASRGPAGTSAVHGGKRLATGRPCWLGAGSSATSVLPLDRSPRARRQGIAEVRTCPYRDRWARSWVRLSICPAALPSNW